MTTQNVIRTLTLRAATEGFPKSTSDLKNLQTAHENVAKVTETTAKHQLSMEKAFAQSERRFNSTLRAQQDFEKVQRQINAAVAQNPALQARANDVLRLASEHFGKASAGQAAFSRGMQAANDNLQSFAMRAGPVGSILAGFGPAGIAAAVGIGILTLGLHQAAGAALALAERAGKLKDFAETTGFTVIQLQALEKAAAQVGVSSESVTKGLERFSRQMVDVRKSTGETYDQLARVDIGLARQVSRTENLADAWDLVSKAIKAAPLEQANKIAVAFFGREGIQQTRLMRAGADAGGIAGLVSQLKEVDRILPEQAERWDALGDSIAENMKAAKQNITSIFADSVLQSLKEMSDVLLDASRGAKEFDWSQFAAFFKAAESVLPALTLLRALTQPASTGVTHGLTSPQADAALGGMARVGGNKSDKESVDIVKKLADETIRLSNEEKKRMEALGGAATANEKRIAKEKEMAALKAEYPHLEKEATRQLVDFNREAASSALSARIGLLGDMAAVEDVVRQKQDAINRANKDGAGITAEQTRALLEKARVQAEAAGPDAQIGIQRQAIFLLEEEAQIRQQLLAWGERWNSEEGERLAGQLRFNNALKEIKDISTTALSGFAKDIDNGVKPMDAMVNQAKRLQDIFIDMAAKKIVAGAMGAAFGGVLETAGASAGATTAAGIWTTAGGVFNTALVAAATSAASILGGGGAVASTELQVGGVKAGTDVAAGGLSAQLALIFGGTAAGWALWGPIAALVAAVAAVGAVIGLGGNSAEKERSRTAIQGYRDRATLARTDTSTLHGSLSEFDMRARSEKAALPNGGLTQKSWTNTLTFGLFGDKGGKQTQESIALDQALAAERLRVIEDFGKRAVEAEKQAAADRLATLEDFGRAMNEVKGQSFLNDFADLFKQIATYRTAGADPSKLTEFLTLSAQQIVDDAELTGQAFNGLINRFPQLNGMIHEFAGVIEEVRRSAEEITSGRQSLRDQLFTLLQDQDTLGGRLAVFERAALRDRQAEVKAGGELLADMEALQFQQRLDIIKDFNAEAIAEQKRAAEESAQFFASLRRNLREFIDGMRGGAQSPLSPSARLLSAQTSYNQQIGLAQGGDRDALSGITQYASTLIDAARSFYGSSTGFQSIFNQIASQLEALPDIAQSADPVVNAIQDAQVSNDALLAELNLLMDANKDGVVTAAERLAFIKTATEVTGDRTDTMTQLMNSSLTLTFVSNSILTAVRDLTQTSRDQLNLLTSQLTGGVALSASSPTGNAFLQSVIPQTAVLDYFSQYTGDVKQGNQKLPAIINSTMLQALQKIEFNTAATAHNTAERNRLAGGGQIYGMFERGGTAAANSLAIFGEHHPQGPWGMRVGSEPVTFSPGVPSFGGANDNGAVASRIDRLERTIDTLLRQQTALLSRIAASEERNVDATDRNTAHRESSEGRRSQTARIEARKNKVA